MVVKTVAFAAVFEYAFLKPYIIPRDPEGYESTDFIGYSLVRSLSSVNG